MIQESEMLTGRREATGGIEKTAGPPWWSGETGEKGGIMDLVLLRRLWVNCIISR